MTTALVHLMTHPARPARSAREVVPTELWDKQVGLLVRDHPYDSTMAGRVLDQGYAYLLTAMKHRGESLELTPSTLVDIGIQTITLDALSYADLCDRFNGGHLLHHVPKAGRKAEREAGREYDGSVTRTATVIASHGWAVDLPLWTDAVECGPRHPGNDSR